MIRRSSLNSRTEHRSGSDGFGPLNPISSETEERINRPTSVRSKQRFGRVAVGIGSGLDGSVNSVCSFSINKLSMRIFSGK